VKFGGRAHSLSDIEFIAEAGFDFAEIDLEAPEKVAHDLSDLMELRGKYDIFYLAHGPSEGNPLDIEAIEKTLEPRIRALIRLAGRLDIPLYTQHLWLEPRSMDQAVIQRKIEVLDTLSDYAAQQGLFFCLENLSEHAPHLRPAFARAPCLSLTLDIGHGQILSQSNTSFALIDEFADRIKHIHAHDNLGGNTPADDLHLPIGEGVVDFRAIFHALIKAHYNATVTLEIPLEHLKEGRRRIEGILAEFGYSSPLP
jgi:sugar phosphate isomerase/epimerase